MVNLSLGSTRNHFDDVIHREKRMKEYEVILTKEKDRRESYVREISYQSKAMSSPQETIKKRNIKKEGR